MTGADRGILIAHVESFSGGSRALRTASTRAVFSAFIQATLAVASGAIVFEAALKYSQAQ